MSSGRLWFLTTTFPDRESAHRTARLLVDGGLAVCAQVGADLTSYYHWEGEVQEDAEVQVTLKILHDRFDLCVGELKLQHPYDVPQIISWPAEYVTQDYLDWAKGGNA